MAYARSEDLKTPLCRLSYARDLYKARAQEEGKKPKFGCTLIFNKADRKVLEPVIAKVITDQWGPTGIERFKKGLIKNPLLAGDGKEAHTKDGELKAGMGPDVFFIRPTANEERAPRVWFRDPNKQETEDVVYSGCYGKGVIHFYAWHHEKSGDMICVGVSGFQKLQDGERLGGSGAIDTDKWNETIADDGPAPETTRSGAGASALFGD